MADVAQFTEDKHRRDRTGKFSRTSGGGGGAAPAPAPIRPGVTLYAGGAPYRLVGRTVDGRVVVQDADGNRHTADPKALTSKAPPPHARPPADPREVQAFHLGDRLPQVVAALKADGVPVWTDPYGQVSITWNGRQMNLHGTGV